MQPNMEESFEIQTDASENAVGAVLRQKGLPIAFASRVLTETERNYGITEREFSALVWRIVKFEFYLRGKKFICITDHKPLTQINHKKDFNDQSFQDRC